jgi:hypothetical protein
MSDEKFTFHIVGNKLDIPNTTLNNEAVSVQMINEEKRQKYGLRIVVVLLLAHKQ